MQWFQDGPESWNVYEGTCVEDAGKHIATARCADHARLIAAAPELLRALESAYDQLKDAGGCCCTFPEPDCCASSLASAAIARVTGGQL